jgi:hypothetical protein
MDQFKKILEKDLKKLVNLLKKIIMVILIKFVIKKFNRKKFNKILIIKICNNISIMLILVCLLGIKH